MSSHRKNWKECSYVKNDHSRDSQSSLSESRSNQSFRFSQIKFNKSKHQHKNTSKKFTLISTGSRINQFKHDRSLLQQSNRMKQNSMIEPYPKQPSKFNTKTPSHRNLESKMKVFLYGIKKIHEDMKLFAENILYSFQKMKEQLEANLLQVSNQLLKLGKSNSEMEKVNAIFHKGFAEIKRAVTFLPESLTKLGEFEESNKVTKGIIDWNPLPRIDSLPEGQSCTKIVSNIFISKGEESSHIEKEQITNNELDITLVSNGKLKSRPSTQRRNHLRTASFEQGMWPKTYRKDSKSKNEQPVDDKKTVFNQGPSLGESLKIDEIISQMRQILNQSN